MSRWVVIGGTGYIGAAVCHRLVDSGQEVVSLSRAHSGVPECEGNPRYSHVSLELVPGQLPESLFQHGDRIVYAAGLADRRTCERRPELALWLNSECPLALLRCADAAGAESFTYLSSVKAVRPPSGVVADEGAGEPAVDAYGKSKWAGEQQLFGFSAQCRLNVIRPAAVYGEGIGQLRSRGRAGRLKGLLGVVGPLLPVVPASGRRSFVSLEDLVRAIVMVTEARDCHRKVFIAAEPRFYDLPGILAEYGVRVRASERLTRFLLWPFRTLGRRAMAGSLLELENSELYSAAHLRRALPWRAEQRYSRFLRGIQ
ncbi:NAD-dependent epimerase/dehydratase family protein [Microbulbifer yueqingensis]|uniref:Nucleoside-diphosphate-sugar epimerase n=1 Tax=Microbulbifer yueqingensis TaxID=658219 RepID=A0A1G8UGH4_9GAMM|nr:NAD-dependent epimerase/dehydratase family protein [Microbulbifer yueqingensis]SDJ52903.1 Nucleoside-diphosphate-sugar epimerase [Microbulbifer yueqingensis]